MSRTITLWGRQCKAQMALKGLSQKELAESIGLSNTYVSAIINGRIVASDETVKKINRVLGMAVEKAGSCLQPGSGEKQLV